MPYQPLQSVRVLDLSKLMGPGYATVKLADLGADVVKVESGSGDPIRQIPPLVHQSGLLHWSLDRGKRSISLDIDQPDGRAVLQKLARTADVIVDSSASPSRPRHGLDLAELRIERPEVVVCSITAFGLTGPLAKMPGHGLAVDALAGSARTVVHDGRECFDFTTIPISIAFELGALHAALAIVAAVFRCRVDGRGEWIDVSCWDAAVEMRRDALAWAAHTREPFPGWGKMANAHRAYYSIYTTADGRKVFLDAPDRRSWEAVCMCLGREDLVAAWDDEAASVVPTAVRDELDAIFRSEPADHWMRRFVERRISGGQILDEVEMIGFEHLQARELVEPPADGRPAQVLMPVRWMSDGSRPGAGAKPFKAVGEDTDDVLAEWRVTS